MKRKRNPDKSEVFRGRIIVEFNFTNDDNGHAAIEDLYSTIDAATSHWDGGDGVYEIEHMPVQYQKPGVWEEYE